MTRDLRPYQKQLVDDVRAQWAAGHRNVLMRLDTGGGKSVILAHMIQMHRGASSVIAHRSELVSQLSIALAREGVYHNLICSDADRRAIATAHADMFRKVYFAPNAPCAVASAQTLVKRDLAAWQSQVSLWVVDEAHHLTQGSVWGKCIEKFTHPHCVGLGPTATPRRADGKGLGAHADGYFNAMVQGPSGRWLIDNKYLTPYKVAAVDSHIERYLGDVAESGDWSQKQLANASQQSEIVGDVVNSYRKFADGKLNITFATDVKTATEMAEQYRRGGIAAEVLTGDTDASVRRAMLRRFAARQISVLVAVDVVSEGFDLPAVEAVTMARPTASLAVFLQQFGRGLRPLDGKQFCQLIDHTGNFLRHGGGPDTPRVWSLDRRDKRKKKDETEIKIRVCLNVTCGLPFEAFRKECPHCGQPIPPPAERGSPDVVEGELSLLDESILAKLRGDIADVDMTLDEYRAKLVAAYVPVIGIHAHVKRHAAKQEAQQRLRSLMAAWGGYRKAEGLSDAEIQRAFWYAFKISVLEAQALGITDADKLAEAIRNNIPFERSKPDEWTIDRVWVEAAKYETRGAFEKGSDGAYQAAQRRGVLDKVCAHMDNVLQSWNHESIAAEAAKYETRGDFKKNNIRAYQAARRLGILDETCAHMVSVRQSWNHESIAAEAAKYETRKSFEKNSLRAYTAARRLGIFDEVCAHMVVVRQSWNHESVAAEAAKYEMRYAFQKGNRAAYGAALRLGILDQVCSHMTRGRNA